MDMEIYFNLMLMSKEQFVKGYNTFDMETKKTILEVCGRILMIGLGIDDTPENRMLVGITILKAKPEMKYDFFHYESYMRDNEMSEDEKDMLTYRLFRGAEKYMLNLLK